VQLAVKLPDDPRTLGIADPYPDLLDDWNPTKRQWSWQVASPDDLPDVERAIEIAQRYETASEPMALAGATVRRTPAAMGPHPARN
jgi:hypothetical protein